MRFGAIVQLEAPEMQKMYTTNDKSEDKSLDFNLKCVEGDEMICSTPKMYSTLGSATYSPYNYFKNGEINQSVGLAEKKRTPETAVKPMHFRWKCLNAVPGIRFETEGDPVPSNTKLVICHSATHKLLAAENTLFEGIFGKEYGLSVQTYQTVQKIETFKNIWSFKTRDVNLG
ncbi:Cilia- and flagella-associated protein [Pseudolycoriella hygida]|uniref:Cilia- and flagella-associated protein n=1 Tax=Pseudolycoriella hygida TaxID=35572 RepID=A0A9Q0S5L7_9DIPT|nr:Cilia- and flagella-associated protein [Pseudolycoriella hygida]